MIDAAAVKARISAVDVARAHGIKLHREGGRYVGRCPLHDEATGSFTVWPNRWHCFGCGNHGTVIDLEMALSSSTFADAVRKLAEAPMPARTIATDPPRSYPPADEVAELWARCAPIDQDLDVAQWLGEVRGLNVARTVERDVARALPTTGALPAWARRRSAYWRSGGFRFVLPMWNECGELASLHARSIVPSASAKATSPLGFTTKGLVMANAAGRSLLTHRVCPRNTGDYDAVVVEGAPAFVAWAVDSADHEREPPIFGVIAGSWTAEVAGRIPGLVRVVLDLDTDAAGQRYRDAIAATLDDHDLFTLHRDAT